jgi:hypothetical protein
MKREEVMVHGRDRDQGGTVILKRVDAVQRDRDGPACSHERLDGRLARANRTGTAPARAADGTAEPKDSDARARGAAPVGYDFIHSNMRGTGSSAFESRTGPGLVESPRGR